MTKHQPATPLPFAHVQALNHDNSIIGADGSNLVPHEFEVNGRKVKLTTRDARYIAHTANAYPRLVEKASAIVARLDNLSIPGLRTEREELRALLRELGEDA